jgi:hypothetical protein
MPPARRVCWAPARVRCVHQRARVVCLWLTRRPRSHAQDKEEKLAMAEQRKEEQLRSTQEKMRQHLNKVEAVAPKTPRTAR